MLVHDLIVSDTKVEANERSLKTAVFSCELVNLTLPITQLIEVSGANNNFRID